MFIFEIINNFIDIDFFMEVISNYDSIVFVIKILVFFIMREMNCFFFLLRIKVLDYK